MNAFLRRGLFVLLALLMASLPNLQAADADDNDFQGMILSVRGNVLELRPSFLRGVRRVLVDDKTSMVEEIPWSIDQLKVGDRVHVYALRDKSGEIHAGGIDMGTPTLMKKWYGKETGIQKDDWDKNAVQFGGTLRSLKPFAVVDDLGHAVEADTSGMRKVTYWKLVKVQNLLIGRMAFVTSDTRAGDIIHATEIDLGANPGAEGTVFGKVVSLNGKLMTLLPKFSTMPLVLQIDPAVKAYRQVDIDSGTAEVGQTISVWGGQSAWDQSANQITAYVIIPGKGVFPADRGVKSNAVSSAGRMITGTILGFHPLRIRTPTSQTFTITVPGQIPFARYQPSNISSAKPNSDVMVILKQNPAGLVVKTLVVDASPVAAMGLR